MARLRRAPHHTHKRTRLSHSHYAHTLDCVRAIRAIHTRRRRDFLWRTSFAFFCLLVVARSALWLLERNKKEMFDADASFSVREKPTFNKYTSFQYGGAPGLAENSEVLPPPRHSQLEDMSILSRQVSRDTPPPPPMTTGLSNLDASEMVAKMRAEVAAANMGPINELHALQSVPEMHGDSWLNEISSQSGRRTSEVAAEGENSPSAATCELGLARVVLRDGEPGTPAAGAPPSVSVGVSGVDTLGPLGRSSTGTAASTSGRGTSTSTDPGSVGSNNAEPAWKKYARPRGSVVTGRASTVAGGPTTSTGGRLSSGPLGGGRLSTVVRGGASSKPPPAATPQAAAFAAALKAWPTMPETLQHLPLSMALEDDPRDDPTTKGLKAAARKAADEAVKALRAEQDAARAAAASGGAA